MSAGMLLGLRTLDGPFFNVLPIIFILFSDFGVSDITRLTSVSPVTPYQQKSKASWQNQQCNFTSEERSKRSHEVL